MFGIRFMKAPPTTYVLHYVNGVVRRQGPGLSFFYWGPTSTIVQVPLASRDAPFFFEVTTGDYQAVTIQGQVAFRVEDPERLASLLDLSMASDGSYRTEDLEKLDERLLHTTQVLARGQVQTMPLPEVLAASDTLGAQLLAGLRAAEGLETMGVQVLDVSVLAIKPTPDTARALEAEARESLLRRSDEAIYARRNAAVEQERRIKASEAETERAMAEKDREIRQAKMDTEVDLEHRRAKLIESRVENDRLDADAKAYALEKTLGPIRDLDWRTLMAAGGNGGMDSGNVIALAFQQLAENADKIGTLNVSPDLLERLLDGRREG